MQGTQRPMQPPMQAPTRVGRLDPRRRHIAGSLRRWNRLVLKARNENIESIIRIILISDRTLIDDTVVYEYIGDRTVAKSRVYEDQDYCAKLLRAQGRHSGWGGSVRIESL